MHFREEEKQAENRWRLFLKISIELSVYIYIKKVAEKEALLRRGDAIADFRFWKNRSLCVRTIAIPSLRSLQIRSAAPRKRQAHVLQSTGGGNVTKSTILQSDVF